MQQTMQQTLETILEEEDLIMNKMIGANNPITIEDSFDPLLTDIQTEDELFEDPDLPDDPVLTW